MPQQRMPVPIKTRKQGKKVVALKGAFWYKTRLIFG